MKMDRRVKISKLNEANLYRFQAALDTILEFLHKDIDLYSAAVEECDTSVRTESMEGFQARVGTMIDKLNEEKT